MVGWKPVVFVKDRIINAFCFSLPSFVVCLQPEEGGSKVDPVPAGHLSSSSSSTDSSSSSSSDSSSSDSSDSEAG